MGRDRSLQRTPEESSEKWPDSHNRNHTPNPPPGSPSRTLLYQVSCAALLPLCRVGKGWRKKGGTRRSGDASFNFTVGHDHREERWQVERFPAYLARAAMRYQTQPPTFRWDPGLDICFSCFPPSLLISPVSVKAGSTSLSTS